MSVYGLQKREKHTALKVKPLQSTASPGWTPWHLDKEFRVVGLVYLEEDWSTWERGVEYRNGELEYLGWELEYLGWGVSEQKRAQDGGPAGIDGHGISPLHQAVQEAMGEHRVPWYVWGLKI